MTQRRSRFPRLLTVLLIPVWLLNGAAKPDKVDPANPKSASELIQQVEKRYNGAQTLSINFVENYSVLGHARPSESGTLRLRKQGKMRWDYSQPKGKLFVSDGKNVFLYTSRDNRVEKVPLKNTEDMRAPLAFLLGRLDMKKEFRDFGVRKAVDGSWLDASAKTEHLPYSSVEMLIGSDGDIRELRVKGRDESVTALSFSQEKLNAPAPNELFHFDVPPGAEVVDALDAASQEK